MALCDHFFCFCYLFSLGPVLFPYMWAVVVTVTGSLYLFVP